MCIVNDCIFDFDGPFNGNTLWEVTIKIDPPTKISKWKFTSNGGKHFSAKRAHLVDLTPTKPSKIKIIGSDIVEMGGNYESGELKENLELKKVKVVITEANVDMYCNRPAYNQIYWTHGARNVDCRPTDTWKPDPNPDAPKGQVINAYGIVGHSGYQLYLSGVDFLVGSGCAAGVRNMVICTTASTSSSFCG